MSSPINEEAGRMLLLRTISSVTKRPYFNILTLGTMCPKCLDLKKPTCSHRADNRSQWKSSESERRLKDLLPRAFFEREVLGIQNREDLYLFERAIIKFAFSPIDGIVPTPAHIYNGTIIMAFDPPGGGAASMLGVALLYFPARANHVTVFIHPCM